MRSAYPSSHSFFDSTSDSIRAEDVGKCRSSASFSSLSDLFSNPSTKSDLFPNARAPVFVPEEVRFPAKKKRECEERTSIWHEWGSGECQTENVAQESSGFSSDLIGPSGSTPSLLSSSSFPNLGSAKVSLVTEDFTYPDRKKREEGSSWREERTSWQDWSTSGAPEESTQTEGSPIVGPITDMYLSKPCTKPFDLLTNSKSSPFSSLGAPARSASEESSFPARKKREERSFWRDSNLDGTQSDCKAIAIPRESMPGVSSLADMFLRKAGTKCSNLFSNAVGSTEEVVFPKRKNHADRNAWRDWTNTGYGDYEDETEPYSFCVDNSSRSSSAGATEFDGLPHSTGDSPACAGTSSIDGSISIPGKSAAIVNLPVSQRVLRSFHGKESTSLTSEVQVCEAVSVLSNGVVGNVDESGCSEACIDRFPLSTASEAFRSMGGAESSASMEDSRTEVNVQESRFPNSRNEQRSNRHGKYPPPLRSLSRQGSSSIPHHMPWVQLQTIRSEGRIVLQEGKVTQPVVFQPIRKEGRLVLQLIGQEKSFQKWDAGKRLDGNRPASTDEEATVLTKTLVNRTETNEMVKGKPHIDQVALAEKERRKKSAKVWPVSGSLAETERSEKASPAYGVPREKPQAEVTLLESCPSYAVPPEKLPGEGSEFEAREAAAAAAVDIFDRKSFNLRELCIMAEGILSSSDRRIADRERPVTADGGFVQERPSPWLLGKVSPDDRKLDTRTWLHSDTQLRNAVERVGQKENVISFHKVRETAPLRAHFQALPRPSSLRNGLSGLKCTRVDVEVTPTRSRSIRSSSLSDFATLDSGKEEKALDSVRGRASDARPSLSVCQGIVRDTVLSLATAHSFLRSLRTRPDIPGEPDARYSNYPVAAAFSCADGMEKRHHEKNFWEQQPCVS